MYQDGLTLVINMFDGIAPKIYPTNKMETQVEYSAASLSVSVFCAELSSTYEFLRD